MAALLVYSTQLLVVVGVATVAASVCRLSDPGIRLTYWQSVAALCLVLPLLAPGRSFSVPASITFTPAAQHVPDVAAPAAFVRAALVLDWIPWILLTGALLRVAWLVAGALHVRRICQRSTAASLDDDIDALRRSVAPSAEVRWSEDIRGPVGFGFRRPVILLPPRFLELDADARRGVACHELVHAARGDWPLIMIEELARGLFWFHPGVWWLVDQIQVSREALVDRLVVNRLGSKRAYMSALLLFADQNPAVPLVALLRKHHLRSRLRQLAVEPSMSRRRLVSSIALLVFVVGGTGFGIARALPLEVGLGAAQLTRGRLEIRLAETAPGAGLVEAVVVTSGQRVYLQPATLATRNDVRTARVIERTSSQFEVAITFTESAAARLSAATRGHLGKPVAILLDGRVISAPVLRAPIGEAAGINGLTAEQARSLAESLAPRQAAVIDARNGLVAPPRPLRRVRPQYTPEGMLRRIQGTVVMDAIVNVDGTVSDVMVTRPLDSGAWGLDEEAVRAVKQWTFLPASRNGTPVAARVQLQTEFILRQSR